MELKAKNPKASELFTKLYVKNTPFTIIKHNEKNLCFGTFGKYKITEDFEDVNECEKEVSAITWNRIVQIIALVYEMLKHETKTQEL